MRNREGNNKKNITLGELESAVMEIIWQEEKATVRDMLKLIAPKRKLAYTTIMTVMTRLVEKGILSREEQENGTYLYKPRYTREEFYAQTSKNIFMTLIANFGQAAIAQFIGALEEMDPKHLEDLRKRLKKGN